MVNQSITDPTRLIEAPVDYCICGHHIEEHYYDGETGQMECQQFSDTRYSMSCSCRDYVDANDPENFEWENEDINNENYEQKETAIQIPS